MKMNYIKDVPQFIIERRMQNKYCIKKTAEVLCFTIIDDVVRCYFLCGEGQNQGSLLGVVVNYF